jgi:hypothetical protein
VVVVVWLIPFLSALYALFVFSSPVLQNLKVQHITLDSKVTGIGAHL